MTPPDWASQNVEELIEMLTILMPHEFHLTMIVLGVLCIAGCVVCYKLFTTKIE